MTPDERAVLRGAAAHVLVDDVEVVALDEDRGHHVFRVLRVRDGEVVTVTDGRGGWRVCRSVGAALEPDGAVHREPRSTELVRIAVAIPKRDRPEWIVQKLTELGVDEITLLHAERSVVRWEPARADKHRRKLARVAEEAVQQSRGVWAPSLVGPVEASSVLAEFLAAEPGGRRITDGDLAVAIGPEGGWSESELSLACDRVELGGNVLRVETAALAAASQLRLR